jgi:hypothetical protein
MQNFLYSTKADDAPLKAIDFGLSDFVLPGRCSTLSAKDSIRSLTFVLFANAKLGGHGPYHL